MNQPERRWAPAIGWVAVLIQALYRFGWMPLSVFIAHELSAHVFRLYGRWRQVDVPLHLLGGFAVAYFISNGLTLVIGTGLADAPHPAIRYALLFGMICAAAMFWEFAEWIADRTIGTCCQLGLDDTLFDMVNGLTGGACYLILDRLSHNG
ncbi:hypothetical protein JW905_11460 [bacterium]|nr:hypothetical protein [candidate division CSSED10-310 bacterium]